MRHPKTTGYSHPWILHKQAEYVLGKLAADFSGQGIRWLLVKGLALAHQIYPNPYDRSFSDVDLRVPPSSLPALRQWIKTSTYALQRNIRSYGNIVLIISGVVIDIEAHIGPPYLCRLRTEDLISRANTIVFSGHRIFCPNVVDHSLVCAINLFKDKVLLASPIAQADFVKLLAHPEFDLYTFLQRAEQAKMVLLSTLVCKLLLTMNTYRSNLHLSALCTLLEKKTKTSRYSHLYSLAILGMGANKSLLSRVLHRLASDAPFDWAPALFWGALYEVESSLESLFTDMGQ